MTHVKISDYRTDITKFIDRSVPLCSHSLDLNKYLFIFFGIFIMDKYNNGQFNYHWVAIRMPAVFLSLSSSLALLLYTLFRITWSIFYFTSFIFVVYLYVYWEQKKIIWLLILIVLNGLPNTMHIIRKSEAIFHYHKYSKWLYQYIDYNTLQWSIDQMRFMQNFNHCMPLFLANSTHMVILYREYMLLGCM